MNEQSPRPDSGAGHEVPPVFSSNTPAPMTPESAAGALPTAPQHDTDTASAAPASPLGAPAASSFGPAASAAQDAPAAATAVKPRVGAGKVAALLVAAALVGGAAGLGGSVVGNAINPPASTSSSSSGSSTVTVNNPESVSEATAIAAKTVPSVVTIEVSDGSSGGSGSGVVLDHDGHILTNAHVVTLDGQVAEPTIRVTTSDGRLMTAEVVGVDPVYDLAVIKVEEGSDLTPIEFADSSELNVGSLTVAVGAPLGLKNSVTTGIVSALNRSIQIQSSALPDDGSQSPDQDQQVPQEDGDLPFQFDLPGRDSQSQAQESISISVIQTDAAINPGNSGGALVNSDGELIGINVAIASAGGSSDQAGSIGVGFAIPSNVAQRVADEIIENGEATHGLLGATVQPASSLENASVVGAAINEVSEGGAAAKAGLKAGDIVTEFNGAPITDAIDLTAQVRAAAAGSEATITFVRDGETQTATATLGTLSL